VRVNLIRAASPNAFVLACISFFVSPLSTPLQMVIAASCVRAHSFLTQGSAGRHQHNTAQRRESMKLQFNYEPVCLRHQGDCCKQREVPLLCAGQLIALTACAVRERVYTILINYRLNVCHQFKAQQRRDVLCVCGACVRARKHTHRFSNEQACISLMVLRDANTARSPRRIVRRAANSHLRRQRGQINGKKTEILTSTAVEVSHHKCVCVCFGEKWLNQA
jgi:hypothetical protein